MSFPIDSLKRPRSAAVIFLFPPRRMDRRREPMFFRVVESVSAPFRDLGLSPLTRKISADIFRSNTASSTEKRSVRAADFEKRRAQNYSMERRGFVRSNLNWFSNFELLKLRLEIRKEILQRRSAIVVDEDSLRTDAYRSATRLFPN